jgi:hypothetical protein
MRPIIPYINIVTGVILSAVLALTGCAHSGNSLEKPPAANGRDTGDIGLVPACKSAIDDVTRYCSGDQSSTGKCADAKERTRQHCIDN